jgi:two-component system OmpR family response regulator
LARILIVDDDAAIREIVRFALEKANFTVVEATDGAAALGQFRAAAPDLIVFDILMPELDGTEVCRTIRGESPVPILFLSSKDDEIDRIVGLEIGGDDYLAKPFSPRELVARVKAILRRSSGPPEARPVTDGVLRDGRLTLDPDRVTVTWDAQALALTATEFGMLRALMTSPGRVLSRDMLMDKGYTAERTVSDRTIDSHIRRLRAKFATLNAHPIETLPGFGYRLGPCR